MIRRNLHNSGGRRCTSGTGWALMLGIALSPSASFAQSITAEISSKNAIPGEVLNVRVRVANLGQANAPSAPQSDEFEIQMLANVSQEYSQRFVNGVQTSEAAYTYTFQVRPLKTGVLTLGPFTVKHGGEVLSTQPIRIRVTEAQAAATDLPLLFLEVTADPESPYVGQPVNLALHIWVKQYNKDGVRLQAGDFWRLQEEQTTSLGVFNRNNPDVREAQRSDSAGIEEDYFVYTLEARIVSLKPGPYDFGNITFGMQYPITFGRDIFRRLTLDQARRIVSRAKTPDLIIRPIPQNGRPPDFNGAVGRYHMTARAKPTDVQTGDPITLTLEIRGEGDFERLSPPKLISVPDLVQKFELSPSSTAGEVVGDRKIFSITIRPLRDDIVEIPRLPFSYLNPDSGEFVTTWTKPIPIKVRRAERLALADTPTPADPSQKASEVENTEGLLSNFTDPDALLADHSFRVGTATWTMIGACPVIFAAVWVFEKRKAFIGGNAARLRRDRAFSTAKQVLGSADGNHQTQAPQRAREAVIGYIADRCGVPAAGLTRHDAVTLLRQRGVSSDTIRSVDGFLEQLEHIEYGGIDAAGDTIVRADQLLNTLEGQRIR